MTRYREMTDQKLIDWALEFRAPGKAESRLIYALAKRLEERSPQTRATVPESEPRPRGHLTLAMLSREAKEWLREHRPERLENLGRAAFQRGTKAEQDKQLLDDIARQQWQAQNIAHGCHPLSGLVNQGMGQAAGLGNGRAASGITGCHYRVCGGCGRRL